MTRERFIYCRDGEPVNAARFGLEHKDWLELWEMMVCRAYARATGRLFLACALRHRLTNGVGVYGWAYWGSEMHAILGDAVHLSRWLGRFEYEHEKSRSAQEWYEAERQRSSLADWMLSKRGPDYCEPVIRRSFEREALRRQALEVRSSKSR